MQTKLLRPKSILFFSLLSICCYSISFSQTITPYKAKEIQPYQAKTISTDVNKTNNTVLRNYTALSSLFGLYELWIQGTSYTTTDYSNQTVVLHNSAGTGVLPGGLKINANKTYVWNSSWDGKIIKGIWRLTGDNGYPIELIKAQEGKNWKIGNANAKGVSIYIWDGSTWYNGRKK